MNDQILPPTGQTQPPDKFFETLVGEGKKFRDPEALAKSKWDSDEYIKTLERQRDEMREDLVKFRETSNAQANMQELIDQFKQLQQTQGTNTQQPQSQQKPAEIDPNKIAELAASQYRKMDQEKTESANLKLVQDKIKEKWGTNIPPSVKEQVDKLGDLGTNLARKYPEEFLRTIGATEPVRAPSFQSPPRTNVNSDTLRSPNTQERTWSWWEDLRKKDPTTYYSKKMTVQMHNDAQRLGDKFIDGDFDVSDRDLLASKYNNL